MTNLTPFQHLKAAQQIKQMTQIHNYYKIAPGCTIKQAEIFHPKISSTAIKKYSRMRSECNAVIKSVIDMRYGCVWPQDDIVSGEVVRDV